MTGIVKAVSKELEPEDPFKIHVVDYKATLSSKALLWSRQNLCYFLVVISVEL